MSDSIDVKVPDMLPITPFIAFPHVGAKIMESGQNTSLKDCGNGIAWAVVSMTLGDVRYFVHEFKNEIKKHPDALQECSRWGHHLLDMVNYVDIATKDHVTLDDCHEQIELMLNVMGQFVCEMDITLGIDTRHVANTTEASLGQDACLKRIKEVVRSARELATALSKIETELSDLLPDAVRKKMNDRIIVNLYEDGK